MKKYFAFMMVTLKTLWANVINELGGVVSFCIHILVFNVLWDFILEGKTLAGYSKVQLIWYVIMAETLMYSFHNYYKKIANKIEMGDFAYEMSKPYNFLLRIVSEGVAELPYTILLIIVGTILGVICVGTIQLTVIGMLASISIMLMAAVLSLMMHMSVGLTAIWLGRDVSSIWLLVSKAMLLFAFSPIELFPKWLQPILMLLPTTHVIYTPSSTFVNFSASKFVFSFICEVLSLIVLSLILVIIYKKGVKKQNVNGI